MAEDNLEGLVSRGDSDDSIKTSSPLFPEPVIAGIKWAYALFGTGLTLLGAQTAMEVMAYFKGYNLVGLFDENAPLLENVIRASYRVAVDNPDAALVGGLYGIMLFTVYKVTSEAIFSSLEE